MLDWIEKAGEESTQKNEILSFQDYTEILKEHPRRELRPTFQYLTDMIQHYGKSEDGTYKVFQQEHNDSPAVFGQNKVQESLVQNLRNFQEEGFNNKFILFVGPNGSSKSSLVRKLMKGTEDYSELDDGALYTFSWIFPIDNFVKGGLGFSNETVKSDLNSFAYLEDKDISAILNSELKDHPVLLIPLEARREIIDEALADFPEVLDGVRKSWLYNGDLSKRNRMIYDALLKNHKGRHLDVLKYIRVERFRISKRYSTGAVTVEPQVHVDAQMQQITMDKRLGSLPPSLQSLNLFSLKGEAVLANRGILEYSDLLKRPLDAYKYLLMTMETKNVNLHGILTELDIFFIGTSNEVHLAAFKQHPDFNSFKGRFNFVKVPYLLNYVEEEKIYKNQIVGLSDRNTYEPHALSALCLFAVMTRLRAPQVKNYSDKKLANIATNLNPMDKALFISGTTIPDRLDSEGRQILKQNKNELLNEFEGDNLYEGKFGISPRDMKNIIYKLSSRHKTVTFLEIVDYLQKLITKKNEYDFLNMTPQADYHHPARFVALIKDYCLKIADKEVRDSLGMVDDRSYEKYIRRYIENVTAYIKKEKVKNQITGKYEESDSYFIEEFENNINLKESADVFRGHLLSKLGAYSLDNPGQDLNYTKVFPNLSDRLQESFRNEQKKVLQVVARNLVFFEAELDDSKKKMSTPLSQENKQQIQTIVDNLINKFGYSQNGAISVMKFVIKEKY
ncbi:hypothetical protein OAT67_01765 [Bacteriovoracaceae bacterium]|nr:hypothetical protein [Bacteriovoracaceae bacterium]